MARHNLLSYAAAASKLLGLVFLRGIAYVWPRSAKSVVIGGYCGDLYIDNPKYLLAYLLEHTSFRVTWIGKEHIREQLPQNANLSFAAKGSLLAFWRLLNAKTWICCQAINVDLTSLPILGRGICIDLWHGIPVKYIGAQTPSARNANAQATYLGKMYQKVALNLKSWLVVSNDKMIDILCGGVPFRYNKKRILPFGTPRNDFLINHAADENLKLRLRCKYARLLGFDSMKKIVLYLPTWRMRGDCVFAFYNQSTNVQEEWQQVMDECNAVLIEKHHYATYARYPIVRGSVCSITISAEQQKLVDVQELLLIADVLISDYSGAYIDFALLKRPVIHFAYDLDEYSQGDSGLAYNLYDVAAGPIVSDVSELKYAVRDVLLKADFTPAKGFHLLVEYERGDASVRIADFLHRGNRSELSNV